MLGCTDCQIMTVAEIMIVSFQNEVGQKETRREYSKTKICDD